MPSLDHIYCYVVNSYLMSYNRYRNRPNKRTMRIHVPFQDYIASFESKAVHIHIS